MARKKKKKKVSTEANYTKSRRAKGPNKTVNTAAARKGTAGVSRAAGKTARKKKSSK